MTTPATAAPSARPGLPRLRSTGPVLLVIAAWTAVFARALPTWDSRAATHPGPMNSWSAPSASDGGAVALDLILHLWQYDHVARAIREGLPVFSTRDLLFPSVLDLRSVWGGHLDLLVGVPLVGPLTTVGVSNTVIALFLLAGALGTWRLATDVCGDRWAAAVAASLYVLSPPVLMEVANGRSEEVSVGLAAFVFLFLGRWFLRGRPRDLVGLAVSLALAVFGYLGTGMMLAFGIPAVAAGFLPHLWDPSARPDRRAVLRRGAALVALLALLAIPVVITGSRHLSDWFLADDPMMLVDWRHQAQRWGVVLPWVFLPFPFEPPAITGAALPLLALPLFALRRGRGRILPWLLGTAVLYLLAMGSVLRWDGLFSVTSPYVWLPRVFPWFGRFHWPNRIQLLGALLLAVLGAIGLARMRAHLGGRRGSLAAAGLGAAALVLGLAQARGLVPMPTAALPPVPGPYHVLARDPSARALLEIPIQRMADPEAAQLTHRVPICCLDLPHRVEPRSLHDLDATHPTFLLLRMLPDVGDIGTLVKGAVLGEEARREIADLGFTHVMVHDRNSSASTAGCWPDTEPGSPAVRCPPAFLPQALARHLFGAPIAEGGTGSGFLSLYSVEGRPAGTRDPGPAAPSPPGRPGGRFVVRTSTAP